MDWDLFIGRFHPMLVHLPIGIFLLGYFLEIQFQLGYRRLINSRNLIVLIYGVGLMAGILAAVTGWLLSLSDDYGIVALNYHKLLAIATLVVMLFVIIYQVKAKNAKGKVKLAVSTIAIILTTLTGHFGGNLTHGPGFLFKYGPGFLNSYEDVTLNKIKNIPPDSVKIYTDILYPIIQNNCLACHNSKDYKGGLILETYSGLFKKADHAIPVTPKNLNNSEVFIRVSLPANHEKAMPPRGSGFGYTGIEILKYWIETGADSLATFNSNTMSEELIALIKRDYGLDYRPRPYYEKIKIDSVDNNLLVQLRRSGFGANYLSQSNFLLDVSFKSDSIGIEQIQNLNRVADHITFLTLSDCKLSEELMETLAEMPHLNRIDFSKNHLNSKLIPFLIKHKHLESVNLIGTELTNESLQSLLEQSGLSCVYVLDTKVTEEELLNLRRTYENTEIISEFKFEEVDEPKSFFYKENDER